LASTNYLPEAIQRTNWLVETFYKAIQNSENVFLTDEVESSNYERKYSMLIVFIKSLLKFMKRKCMQMNYTNESSKYHIIEKELECKHLRLNRIEKSMSDDVLFEPKIYMAGNPIQAIVIYGHITDYKGLKKIKFKLRLIMKILRIRISNVIWGYGESIYKVIRFSIFLILSYTLLMQIGLIKVISTSQDKYIKGFLNYLYFSIVTFTSLGYGDIQPFQSPLSRLLMASEAIFGLICISLLIYLIGKKSFK